MRKKIGELAMGDGSWKKRPFKKKRPYWARENQAVREGL